MIRIHVFLADRAKEAFLTACALLSHACLRFFPAVNLKSNSFAPSGVHVAPPNLNRIYRNAHAEPFAPGSSTPHKSSPDSPGPRHFARSRELVGDNHLELMALLYRLK
jgi:hypothetical protein